MAYKTEEENREYQKKYRDKNKERAKRYQEEYKNTDPEMYKLYQKMYQREYYLKHRDLKLEQANLRYKRKTNEPTT